MAGLRISQIDITENGLIDWYSLFCFPLCILPEFRACVNSGRVDKWISGQFGIRKFISDKNEIISKSIVLVILLWIIHQYTSSHHFISLRTNKLITLMYYTIMQWPWCRHLIWSKLQRISQISADSTIVLYHLQWISLSFISSKFCIYVTR